MVSSLGTGFSRWKGLGVSRWQEDSSAETSGFHLFIRDLETDDIWSATHAPTLKAPDTFELTFSEHKAEFVRTDRQVRTRLEILVSPEDDLELRIALAQLLEQRRAVHFRHHHVGDDEIDHAAVLLQHLDRLDAIAGLEHRIAARIADLNRSPSGLSSISFAALMASYPSLVTDMIVCASCR